MTEKLAKCQGFDCGQVRDVRPILANMIGWQQGRDGR
jgi:hypothetical protein